MEHTVLFVDDEPMVLDSIRRSLHRELYTVVTATSAADALRQLSGLAPSVIVSDMRMPGIDGIGFLTEARKILPDAVYLMLSAYSDIEKIMQAINEGHVWRYIAKPWQKEELRLAVNNALEIFEFRESKKELLAVLEIKNRQLEEINVVLEEKVRERTRQLQEKNAILQMLAEDADIQAILERICRAAAVELGASPIFIEVPFLARWFSDTEVQPLQEERDLGARTAQERREVADTAARAVPLVMGNNVLGSLIVRTMPADNVPPLGESLGGFISAAAICLLQARNMQEIPDLSERIDRLVGEF
jgi:CheY-like chemotaxis protein